MLGSTRYASVIARGLSVLAAIVVLQPALVGGATVQSRQTTTSAAAPDVTKLGPQIGEKVPDFTLADQHGQMRTLASLIGPKGLVLVFNRSADW